MLNHGNNDGPLNKSCWDDHACSHAEKNVNHTPCRKINSKWVNRSRISMQKEGEKGGGRGRKEKRVRRNGTSLRRKQE